MQKIFLAVLLNKNCPTNMESFLQILVMVINLTSMQSTQLDYHANKGQKREATGNSRGNL